MFRLALTLCCVVLAAVASAEGAEDHRNVTPAKDFLAQVEKSGGRTDFVFGDDRPFQSCHASTLAATADGTLLCAWFGGTKEKHPDVAIWLSRFTGGTWTPPIKVAKINETAHWNPVLFCPDGKRVYLFFKVAPEIADWQTFWMHSDDAGATWSTPVELVPGDTSGGRGPVRCKPIVLSDGAWLAGASSEQGPWKPFADRSEDQGKTWQRSADFEINPSELRGRGAIQPTLWEHAPGKVRAYLRSQGGRVWQASSEDGGRTWGPVQATALPNNNSGVDFVALPDGKNWMIYNPVSQNWGVRSPISLARTSDGEKWERFADLEDEPMQEFSYPAMIATPDGGVAISYTWKRERVRVWQFKPQP